MSFTLSTPSDFAEIFATDLKCRIESCSSIQALPYGLSALLAMGGTLKTIENEEKASTFDMSLVKIPEGITPETLRKYTLYEILGFGNDGLGDSADVEAIKKCYHKAVLMYHPDKAQFKDSNGKEDRSVFLKIQEAFNVLTDEKKRRAYDSELPFDEAIPNEDITEKYLAKGPEKFFKLYGPVFKRNARFSVKKPVPELGDMTTPMDKVYEFYSFWTQFESWRDFTNFVGDQKADDAGSRYEKRHIEKENKKLAERLKKKEMNRIIDLVTLSEKKDPRIVADKAAQKAAKMSVKEAKEAAAAETENLKVATLAWIEYQETELKQKNAASKADRDKLKKKQSAGRNLLKKLLRVSATLGHGDLGEYGFMSETDVEIICNNATLDHLVTMNTGMGGDAAFKDNKLFVEGGVDHVKKVYAELQDRQNWVAEDERIARDARKREAEEKSSAKKISGQREWVIEYDQILTEAIGRYELGHLSRWIAITNYMNDRCKPPLAFQEIECQIAAYKLTKEYQASL